MLADNFALGHVGQCAASKGGHGISCVGPHVGKPYKLKQRNVPDISRLAPHLQQEWDQAANAHLGSIIVTPQSGRKVWWSSGRCKTGQPHRWLASIFNRTNGTGCPFETGRAVCPCNSLAHNHPDVAMEWNTEANATRTPETVTASSNSKASWICGQCGHKWSAAILGRTSRGAGCPECAHEARRQKTRHPSISDGASHLLAEWDYEANEQRDWHPDRTSLTSHKKVHWVLRNECKLGLVHRWQAAPRARVALNANSPFPSGKAVCACNSLAVQCPEAAVFWDQQANKKLSTHDVAVQSNKITCWKGPDGSQWQQRVCEVVTTVRRHERRQELNLSFQLVYDTSNL